MRFKALDSLPPGRSRPGIPSTFVMAGLDPAIPMPRGAALFGSGSPARGR
ncbi:hypothetical protein J4G37_08400 [Microvirga sp. 3-52]|nr:hypothetical protein [Microvirga sp. 3-52]